MPVTPILLIRPKQNLKQGNFNYGAKVYDEKKQFKSFTVGDAIFIIKSKWS